MTELWNDLLACLDLRSSPRDEEHPESVVFEGSNQHLEYHRLFGGQLLGQFVRAAELTCPEKSIKSLHTVFAREGRADEPVRYETTRLHEGRTFATLTAVARQSKGVLATASVSLHVGEDGPEVQTVASVPPVFDESTRTEFSLIPWETRTTTDLEDRGVSTPEFEMWMRTPRVDETYPPALAAYATDLNLIGTALLAVDGFDHTGNGTAFTSAVTSHNLWFHRPFRSDDWLLLRQHSPLVAHGRCFGRGDLLTEKGSLVASFAQEALLRLP
ncbi:acyl-CoA thioesterase [Rhodococcus sp. B50]|uniref:acyl-CoA thioesterase n=1 Tax=Rhodococcus sp. B50 TaxID=2682847 RepID=UPI001BD34B26|nr:acyl-CoA thioesterase domain-containing protein [Rhodococcus sp. B50]MBS9375125.1 Acyl-CoA thioesterase 2 [Rhodococcus sp. B50]